MTIRALILTVLMTAPASAAFLAGNSPLGEKLLDARCLHVASGLSSEGLTGSGEACLRSAAEFFVAPSASSVTNPRAYSTAFETKLPNSVLGRSRSVHFNRANAALDDALAADAKFAGMMDDLVPGVRQSVSSVGGRQNPVGWTWEHVHSSQAGGQIGTMRLVPTPQHTPGSPWWRVIHPQPGAAGGYSEWAIPRGAPPN